MGEVTISTSAVVPRATRIAWHLVHIMCLLLKSTLHAHLLSTHHHDVRVLVPSLATAKAGVPTNFVPRALTVCEVSRKLCKSCPPMVQCMLHSPSIRISRHTNLVCTDTPQEAILAATQ